MPSKIQTLFYEIIKQSLHRINARRHRDVPVIYIYIPTHSHMYTTVSKIKEKGTTRIL